MNPRFSLFITFLLISSLARCQDSKDAFSSAVDYCNCRVTYTYLNQYVSAAGTAKEKSSFNAVIRPKLENCDSSNPIAYKELAELLDNNNFKTSNQKLSKVIDIIKGSYTDSLVKEDAVKIILVGIFNDPEVSKVVNVYNEINNLKQELERELLTQFDGVFDNQHDNNNPQLETEFSENNPNDFNRKISDLELKIKNNKPSPFAWNWLSTILLIIVSIIVYLLLKFDLTKLDERLSRHRVDIDNINRQLEKVNDDSELRRIIEREINKNKPQIEELQRRINNLSSDMHRRDNEDIQTVSSSQKESYPKTDILYAPMPDKDGSFNSSKVTKIENQGESYYKFYVNLSEPQKANFEFFNTERSIRDATSLPDSILKPVCKIKNAHNQNAKGIKTLVPGLVVKQNDKWILSSHAEIEYE